jgi:hypothetical protein
VQKLTVEYLDLVSNSNETVERVTEHEFGLEFDAENRTLKAVETRDDRNSPRVTYGQTVLWVGYFTNVVRATHECEVTSE